MSSPAPVLSGPLPARAPDDSWLSRIDAAASGLGVDIGLYALSTIFAAITAHNVGLPPHGAWGRMAVAGYAAATLLAVAQLLGRRFKHLSGTASRAVVTAMTFAATALVPMIVEAVQRAGGRTDRAQDEVWVIEDGGARLWHTGTPYLSHDAIAALPSSARLDAYLPYQPGMALYGLPRAVFGVHWWTDARVWFALTLILTVMAAVWLLRRTARATALLRAVQAVTVLPICALTIATGGDDLVILGFCLLAFALAARERFGAAGVAVGVAGAMKLFAWPVALVLLALAATRGRRVAGRYAIGAIGLPIVALIPAILVDRGATMENVIRFPLGQTDVKSPAASPLPGHLIADNVPGGKIIATLLLVVAAIAIGLWLLRRPPRTASAAATVSAWGLIVAIMLIPATRFGYLLYPVAYAVWAAALRSDARSPAVEAPAAG
jgi:Glycosyltransferase family 87